ncbi:MAG: hypothetical protein AVO38_04945 [delta proteobacterium ML8_D]|nr:MAG: hypothetical protein AVO38_04945 [delta proteobacterium ML8_D]
MKNKITLILVLFIVFLLCLLEAFAAAISGPELNLTTSRITVTISWTEVENADGYIFYFAPYPSAYPIWQLDVGPQTGPFVLWNSGPRQPSTSQSRRMVRKAQENTPISSPSPSPPLDHFTGTTLRRTAWTVVMRPVPVREAILPNAGSNANTNAVNGPM